MIFDRLAVLKSIFGQNDQAAAAVSRRWRDAFKHDPELACDVIRFGGVLVGQPVENIDGWPQPASLDPYQLAYEAGRRDFALQLIAQGGITYDELNQLMEAREQ